MPDKKEDKEVKKVSKKAAPEAKETKVSKVQDRAPKKAPKMVTAAVAAARAAEKIEAKTKKIKRVLHAGGKRAPLAVQTTFAKTGSVVAKWKLVDAEGIPLGRLSTAVTTMLMGKDKPAYTPHTDTGDFVVVINAEKVKLTGKKWEDKTYYHHTNYPGGIKSYTAGEVRDTNPERLIEWSVWGMLPKSKGPLVRTWYKKLKVYAGAEHPHKAQQVEVVKLSNIGLQQGSEA